MLWKASLKRAFFSIISVKWFFKLFWWLQYGHKILKKGVLNVGFIFFYICLCKFPFLFIMYLLLCLYYLIESRLSIDENLILQAFDLLFVAFIILLFFSFCFLKEKLYCRIFLSLFYFHEFFSICICIKFPHTNVAYKSCVM